MGSKEHGRRAAVSQSCAKTLVLVLGLSTPPSVSRRHAVLKKNVCTASLHLLSLPLRERKSVAHSWDLVMHTYCCGFHGQAEKQPGHRAELVLGCLPHAT